MKHKFFLWGWAIAALLVASCSRETPVPSVLSGPHGHAVPAFSAESAYQFIQKQVDFGPRYPGSEGHAAALDWKIAQLEKYAGKGGVYAQRFSLPGYDGDTLNLTNVIAAFNVNSADRIMLCAHWDTRPFADADGSFVPVLGADDGGSGVGVLLEFARIFSENPPPIGVDIILFDGEDYGREGDLANYFLGSRYWAQNQPVPGYKPRFGILLDMVGGKGAQFPKEVHSMYAAPKLVEELWQLAGEMGYERFFRNETGIPIQDDHVILNQYLSFPTIDIIHHYRPFGGTSGFPDYWHTQRDNMEIIDPETLDAVGKTLIEMIYNRL